MLIISVLKRLRQEDHEFEASLGYSKTLSLWTCPMFYSL